MLFHLSIMWVCHNLPFVLCLRDKGVRQVIFYSKHRDAQRQSGLYLGSAGGLEKQRICLSSPPLWHPDTCILPSKDLNFKNRKNKLTKNATKETEPKTFLVKNYNTVTQIKRLMTTEVLSPFKTSTKHPRDPVQPFQLWTLPFNLTASKRPDNHNLP